MKDQLFKYFGQRVELHAYGVSYRGKFMGADEDWVYLKAETTWLTIPMNDITSLKPEGTSEANRVHKKIEGEPRPLTREEKEAKRRYFFSDRVKLVEPEEGPEEGEK